MGKKKSRGKQKEVDVEEAASNLQGETQKQKSKKERLSDAAFEEAPSDENPKGEIVEDIPSSKSKKKKGKKDIKAPVVEIENSEASEDEKEKHAVNTFAALEDDSSVVSSDAEERTPSPKKNAKTNTFASLMDEEEDEPDKKQAKNAFASLMDESEEEEEEEKEVATKESANAFASLMDESEEDEDNEPPETGATGNAFASLMDDDNEEEDAVAKEENKMDDISSMPVEAEEDIPIVSKKKSKKKKKGSIIDDAFAALEEEGNECNGETSAKPKKENKAKKGSVDISHLLDEMEEEENLQVPSQTTPSSSNKKSTKEAKKEKNSKKERSFNFEALLDEMEEEDATPEAPEILEAVPSIEDVKVTDTEGPISDVQQTGNIEVNDKEGGLSAKDKKKAKKKKKGNKGPHQMNEDIDAILAELDGDPPPPGEPSKTNAEAKVSSGTQPPASTDPTTVPLPEENTLQKTDTETHPTGEDHHPEGNQTAAAEKAETAETEAIVAESHPEPTSLAVDVEEEGKDDSKETKLTAAQKKKLRKKVKKANEKEKESQKSSAADESKSKSKTSAHVRMIQEVQERQRQEEERRRQEEEAEKARLAEEERLRKEEEQKKEDEARRKAEDKARKEELKKAGLLLTKKQKAEQRRNAEMREQLLKNAGISIASGQDRPGLTPQEQRKIQKEREEEKRKAEAARVQAEEERRLKEEEDRRQKEAESAERRRIEEALKKKQEEEDAIADNWEDISDDDTQLQSTNEAATEIEATELKEAEIETKPMVSSASSKSESESGSDSESEDDSDEGSSSYSEDSDEIRERQVMAAKKIEEARIEEAKAAASADNLRSPICCILGHVDTGKTKILDNIRRTNVQDNEAGGITQQIGATYIPSDALQTRTADLRKGREYDMKVPGLLVIDTPGHESFTNLRSRGSSLCDIAILVVDLMHGLEAQTVESIELLRQKKTPFIIALNKVDRLNDWKVVTNAPIRDTLNRQKKHTMLHFEDRLQICTTMLMERGLNVSLYWKNKEPRRIVNMVPTSAITGEGIPDMLQLLIKLTTSLMAEQLMFLKEVQCSVLEVKAVEGLGTTIDVVLVNGQLNEGDRIVVCGMMGPIVTTIRSLLTPHPLKELRVKGSFLHHKSILAAQGIKICAQNLEHAVAGTALRVVREGEEETCKLLAQEEMEEVMSRIDKSGEGVSVQASTLGSLEALLEFLKTPEVAIPVSAIAIGPVHKKDVMRANVMNEKKLKKFGVILAFDVPVTKEARDLSEELGVKIFTADIIYHLFDQFKAYVEDVRQAEKRAAADDAVFPCILNILPTCIFNKKDPIILGCDVAEGQARIGTPLVAKTGSGMVSLGRIESMELNHKSVDKAQRGDSVAVKIQATSSDEGSKLYGRHFDHTDALISHISRPSINALKAFFKDEMSTDDWNLVIKLKKVFQIE